MGIATVHVSAVDLELDGSYEPIGSIWPDLPKPLYDALIKAYKDDDACTVR